VQVFLLNAGIFQQIEIYALSMATVELIQITYTEQDEHSPMWFP
jgi:hypothetical protein